MFPGVQFAQPSVVLIGLANVIYDEDHAYPMGKGAFVQFQKYGGASGSQHMRHNLREKTRRELRGEIKKFGDWDGVMRHIREIKPLRKSQKVDYLEVVAYPENQAQADAILHYLQTLTHRPVAGVWHFDESKPHVHFIVAWRDEEGRALRLSKSQLRKMREDISHMVGREATPRGQGRKKIPAYAWFAAPDYFKAIAETEQENIERAREGISRVLEVYKAIRIAFLRRGIGVFYYKADVFKRDGKLLARLDSNGKVVPLNVRELYYINSRGGDEVVFRPVEFYAVRDKRDPYTKELKHRTLYVKVFIDDIPQEMIPKLPRRADYDNMSFSNTLLVKTSPGKYQAHFVMAYRYTPRDEGMDNPKILALGLFRFFNYYYKGDIGSRDPYHLRKVPGFLNTKYDDAPAIKWEVAPSPEFDPEEVYNEYYAWLEVYDDVEKVRSRGTVPKREPAQKRWIDFYNDMLEKEGTVDLSRVDMRYAVYLASRGYDETEIAQALIAESMDIEIRKRGHLDDYLKRTVEKAISYVISPEAEIENEGASL